MARPTVLRLLIILPVVLGLIGHAHAFETNGDDEYVKPKMVEKPKPALNDVDYDRKADPEGAPMQLTDLENVQPENSDDNKTGLPLNIRNDAMKEAALSYGARGGLAWRTFMIRKSMDRRSAYMDKVFDFRSLLIPAPSGLLIEPPVISEQDNALLIGTGGNAAAVADKVYDINKNARIVSAPRHWRNYLEREWGDITPPPDLLRPRTDEERRKWKEWVRIGWKKGVEQADEIFAGDLDQLTSDYRGMVRYRMLLTQGMVTPPYAVQTDRGVTNTGGSMRVGDRQVQITGMPGFNTAGSQGWNPASR